MCQEICDFYDTNQDSIHFLLNGFSSDKSNPDVGMISYCLSRIISLKNGVAVGSKWKGTVEILNISGVAVGCEAASVARISLSFAIRAIKIVAVGLISSDVEDDDDEEDPDDENDDSEEEEDADVSEAE